MTELKVTIERTANLTEAVRSAIVNLCIAAHNNSDFKQLFSFLPPTGLHVLGYLADHLISHAVVTTRWLQPAGLPLLKTAYVDAVSTSPQAQGKGYGAAVMRVLAANIADYEIACLETSAASGFYAKVGWELWRGELAGRADSGLVPTPEARGKIMILRLPPTPVLNLDSLLTIEVAGRIW
ncbi:MAG: GNAT family N-acetyltransferase [Anaerolineae bacterium]